MEFALLLPVVLLIIFGIIDFGRMLNAQITIRQAAREGARAYALFDETQARARVAEASRQLGAVTPLPGPPCPANPKPTDDAAVEVKYQFQFLTPLGFFMGSGGTKTLRATSLMPCLH
ncbi:TadE/TadG family type IV pilus assembly protein [Micromonospora sp. SL1-18]|uniref:TadE family protein n=1 Tax=Micromonospora sp. SL1-18 TaxID=3399128 RepID=UPI003A4E2E6F